MDELLRELVHDFRNGYLTRRGFLAKAGALGLSTVAAAALSREVAAQATPEAGSLGEGDVVDEATPGAGGAPGGLPAGVPADVIGGALLSGTWEVVDLSLTTAPNYPVAWPDQPEFDIIPHLWFKPVTDPYGVPLAGEAVAAVQTYHVGEHTGTQIDFAAHFIPPPGVDVEGAQGSEMGLKTGDKYELKTLMGPAVVVDARDLLAKNTENGKSAHLTRAWLERWEAQHGRFRPGDVPIWFSEYTDLYYRPYPDGDRFRDRMLWLPLVSKTAPGWVAADPDAMELLHERGVVHAATDGPSFGWTEGGQPTHVAGLKYGMSWTEGVINVGSLPLRGAFYVVGPYKVLGQQGGIGRAFAIKPAGVPGIGATAPLVLD